MRPPGLTYFKEGNTMKIIEGGVCAAKGFTANGVRCGIRSGSDKKDLALIYSEVPASCAGVYTTNLVKGAPLDVTKAHIEDGTAQAVICNSGNANTCNANGKEIAEGTCALAAAALNIRPEDVVVASTGVIGQKMSLEPFEKYMQALADGLSKEGNDAAAEAIMTTDTVKKEIAVEFEIGGKICRIGGMSKGSGMIHPNMATMLAFITTDAAITPKMIKAALSEDIEDSFNMISVDGDTSTNDMAVILANGLAGNDPIECEGADFDEFKKALGTVTVYLAKKMASDGEGASKLLECTVSGAKDKKCAVTAAKSVICSNLFKAAMFGEDANWGRVLCAIGYSGADIDAAKVDVSFESRAGRICVCENGAGVDFSEEYAAKVLKEKEIRILIDLKDGDARATAWGCDLTYDYVKINGSYRS